MILEVIIEVIIAVFDGILTPINLPQFPDSAMSYIDKFVEYLEIGAGILANYTPFAYLMTLLGIVVAVDVGIAIYHLVMWIIRKFPISTE